MELKQVNDALNMYISPQTFPLALKLCTSESELPERTRMPKRDMGFQVTLCQAIGIARRYRWALAVGKDDQCCIGGARTMGFIPESKGETSADTPNEKQLGAGKYSHLLMAPLEIADFAPDVVLIYASPAQLMRMVQSATRGDAGDVSAVATGFGDCGDAVARTFNSDRCQFIMPSGGDRVFGGTQDHETIFTIPASKIEAVITGLEETHKAGFRYPVLTDLRHQPALPPFLQIPESA